MIGKAKGPALKDVDGEYPAFLWHVWAPAGRKRLHNLRVVDSVVMINGRIRAWIFYSKKEKRILSKKTQNITVQGIWDSFCRGRKSYDCVASFTSPYKPSHLPPCPNWIADGVAIAPRSVQKHVQYFNPKGLDAFLRMAEKHSEFDKAWELQLSKKYNDLAGSSKSSNWNEGEAPKPKVSVWEAAYPDQNIPHGFTGVLRRFDNPMGDTNHEIVCTVTPKMFLCERRSCKYRTVTSGVSMIQRLDIDSESVRLENMGGTAIGSTLEETTRTILQHVSTVASVVRLDKCKLSFRLLPDNTPSLVACVFLRTDDSKAFQISSAPSPSVTNDRWSRAKSMVWLVSIMGNVGQPMDKQELEQPLNVSEDGRTFTCAVSGIELPVEQGHKVTIKQLLDYQKQLDREQSKPCWAQNEVPPVIQRAVPGLKASEFPKLCTRTQFLLSWAFVREAEAIILLRNSLQVLIHPYDERKRVLDCVIACLTLPLDKPELCDSSDRGVQIFNGHAEMEKVRNSYARKREIQHLAALGVPLDREERRLLGWRTTSVRKKSPCTSPTRLNHNSLPSKEQESPSAAKWLRLERPGTSLSPAGQIAHLLDERHLPRTISSVDLLLATTTARGRSEVRFEYDLPDRSWHSVEPTLNLRPLNQAQQASALYMTDSRPSTTASQKHRSASLPAQGLPVQRASSVPWEPKKGCFKARPFPRVQQSDQTGGDTQLCLDENVECSKETSTCQLGCMEAVQAPDKPKGSESCRQSINQDNPPSCKTRIEEKESGRPMSSSSCSFNPVAQATDTLEVDAKLRDCSMQGDLSGSQSSTQGIRGSEKPRHTFHSSSAYLVKSSDGSNCGVECTDSAEVGSVPGTKASCAQASRERREDVDASLCILMNSHDELSAASQTLMRRASDLLQQPLHGSRDFAEVATRTTSGESNHLAPVSPQDDELLTKDEQHLLSDMISAL